MTRYEYSTLSSHVYNHYWLGLLLLLSIIYIIYVYYNQHYKNANIDNLEGFSQIEKFVVKRENNIYDDFYIEIYDKLHTPAVFTTYIMKLIINNTQVSDKSIFLDVGCGTGHMLNELSESGYIAYGIDCAKPMVEHSSQKYPNIMVKQGDVLDPMSFEKRMFSHILCLYYTIYQIENKDLFFKNSYQWLLPGGYLFVHIVEPSQFNTSIPANWNPLFKETGNVIDFMNFTYKQVYNYDKVKKRANVVETFTDSQTKNVRQNEQTLFMSSPDEILKIARYNGFIPHGIVKMDELNEDEHQFIYIFERAL